MTSVMYNEVRIIIGSWGSYNAGNARAMGSKLITLSNYDDWEDIEEELTKQGFQLDGIDEELFVQDVENLDLDSENTDYMSPRRLFETLRDSGVLLDTDKYDVMEAYLEVRSFSDFEALVDDYGENWDDDIHVYKGYGWEEYGREQFSNSGLSISFYRTYCRTLKLYHTFISFTNSCIFNKLRSACLLFFSTLSLVISSGGGKIPKLAFIG